MTALKMILASWNFEPWAVVFCLLLLAGYLAAVRFQLTAKTILYTLGVLVLFLALVSPVAELANHHLFSAHMLQHMMLGSVAPPLLVSGLPASIVRSLLQFNLLARLEQAFGYPPLAMCIRVATLWFWHLPVAYNLAMTQASVHWLENLVFLMTGMILWWPVFKPIPEGRLRGLPAIAYIAAAGFACSIVGCIFTISDITFYAPCAQALDHTGLLGTIRNDWGLTQLEDQKLGGAIMWEPGCIIFLTAAMVVAIEWFKQSEHDASHDHEWRSDHV